MRQLRAIAQSSPGLTNRITITIILDLGFGGLGGSTQSQSFVRLLLQQRRSPSPTHPKIATYSLFDLIATDGWADVKRQVGIRNLPTCNDDTLRIPLSESAFIDTIVFYFFIYFWIQKHLQPTGRLSTGSDAFAVALLIHVYTVPTSFMSSSVL